MPRPGHFEYKPLYLNCVFAFWVLILAVCIVLAEPHSAIGMKKQVCYEGAKGLAQGLGHIIVFLLGCFCSAVMTLVACLFPVLRKLMPILIHFFWIIFDLLGKFLRQIWNEGWRMWASAVHKYRGSESLWSFVMSPANAAWELWNGWILKLSRGMGANDIKEYFGNRTYTAMAQHTKTNMPI